jgi:hypothetical protein
VLRVISYPYLPGSYFLAKIEQREEKNDDFLGGRVIIHTLDRIIP